MDIENTLYVDIMIRGTLSSYRLLTWTAFIGNFVHAEGGEGMR